jgi:hypothetical protein
MLCQNIYHTPLRERDSRLSWQNAIRQHAQMLKLNYHKLLASTEEFVNNTLLQDYTPLN